MPTNVRPMLATLVDKPFDRAGWLFEIKWDGYRVMAEVDKGHVQLYSRNGLSFTECYHAVATALEKIRHQAVLDEEVVVLDDKGHPSLEALQNYRSHRTVGHLVYEIFDILYVDGRDLRVAIYLATAASIGPHAWQLPFMPLCVSASQSPRRRGRSAPRCVPD
jgi:bifunctional non-homologous end joining protein LigD